MLPTDEYDMCHENAVLSSIMIGHNDDQCEDIKLY